MAPTIPIPATVPDGGHIHPFLRGNFAPVTEEFIAHPCSVEGVIPHELRGGMYIRNGGNPVYPPEKGRHYHWFDGDGMLHGVHFPRSTSAKPEYTNRHLATPLVTLTLLLLRSPIPSIALLISPLSSLHRIVTAIIQAFFVALRARMGVLSVANTSVVWWGQGLGKEAEDEAQERQQTQNEEEEVDELIDPAPSPSLQAQTQAQAQAQDGVGVGRAREGGVGHELDQRLLATCESGPPLEVRLPELETVDWDRLKDPSGESLATRRGKWEWWKRLGLSRVQEDWMTAHPRVDPVDGSLIFYSTQMFDKPHVRYSVIDRKGRHAVWKEGIDVGRAKMMHDFAASRTHTILLNLPLTLAPANLFSSPPVPLIHFDRTLPSEFVLFPRLLRSPQTPQEPVRYRESEPSLIFHTANTWDEYDARGRLVAINMLGCRFKSAKLVYAAGAVEIPPVEKAFGADDPVQLHYYRFLLPSGYLENTHNPAEEGTITHSFPLCGIPFEFPALPPERRMQNARYVYGCTMKSGSFDERLGGAAKVDCICKIDVEALIRGGRERGQGRDPRPVDARSSMEILGDRQKQHKAGRETTAIEIFALPEQWYAQETQFVPRANPETEDDGYLLTYVYDESHLLADGTPSTAPDAGSELWIIDARILGEGMRAVVARIKLPQRVPYGLHGTFVPPTQLSKQRFLPSLPQGEGGALPRQELLQTKLARSRLQHFVSILFSRPSSRDKSWVERMVLRVLWPAAACMLGLALAEVGVAWLRSGAGAGAE